mgnify:FL=1
MPRPPFIRHSLLKYLSMVSEMTGYDFLRYCSKNGLTVSPGSVYPLLKKLESEGFVASTEVGRKKTYRLLPAGKEWVENHLSGDMDKDTERALGIFQMTVSCQCGEIPKSLCNSLKSFLLRLGKTNWHSKEQLDKLLGLSESLAREIRTYKNNLEG